MPCLIEPALPGDFLQIAALDRIAWRETGEPFIADGEHVWRLWCEYATVIVARTEQEQAETGRIAAAVVFFPTNTHEFFLHKVMVHPVHRGLGVGTQIMKAALARATAPVMLTVDPDNMAAVQLYKRFGFRVREKIDGFYRAHENRYLMVFTPGAPIPEIGASS